MLKRILFIFGFMALFSVSCFGAGMGDAFQDVYDKVIGLLLDRWIVSLVFIALFVGCFVAMYKLGGLAGFISGAVLLGVGFGYQKMDYLIEKAVGGAGAVNGLLM